MEPSRTLDKIMSVEKKMDKERRGKFFYTAFEKLLQKKRGELHKLERRNAQFMSVKSASNPLLIRF